jgi:hypothetical protein
MLYCLTSTHLLDGRRAGAHFTNRIEFISSLEPGSQELYDFTKVYADLETPCLDSRFEIYAVTISPMVVPGTRKKVRNDHIIKYFNKPGTHLLAANIDPALLTVGAQFFKYATKGTAGEIFMRGVLSEDELKSTREGEADNANLPLADAVNDRFRTYAAGLVPAFQALGGGKLIMPGIAKKPDGTPVTMPVYEASCRTIAKVEFDGFTERQIHKRTRSIEAKGIDLMRSMARQLVSDYNDALQDADNAPGAIPQTTLTDLNEKGHLIFSKFNASERQKLRLAPYIKAFIK